MVNVPDFNQDLSVSRLAPFFRRLSLAASVASMLVGYIVLVAWLADIPTIKSVVPGHVTMKANTALCLLLAGFSLFLLYREPVTRRRWFLSRLLAGTVLFIGAVTLCEDIWNFDFSIDQLLIPEAAGAAGTPHLGRMSPLASTAFVFLGLSLLVMDHRKGPLFSQLFVLLATPIALTTFLGHTFGVKSFYAIASHTHMAIHASMTLGVLCLGIFTARPGRGLMKIITSDSTAGLIARHLLPAAFLVPMALGWLGLWGYRHRLYEASFGLSLFVLLMIMIFGALVLWIMTSLYEFEVRRHWAEELLHRSYGELEKRVEERTVDLKKVNEKLRELDESKSNFLAIAAHELKTPLTAMQGCLALISQGKAGILTRKQKEFIQVVEEAAERLYRLVEGLLDISGIELGRIKMNLERTDLRSLLKQEMMVGRVPIQEKGIILETSFDEQLKEIDCDRDRMREVIENLVSNAVKYTPRNGKVRVEAWNVRNGVEIKVQDSGIGISPEEQEKIFEPFLHIKKAGLDGQRSTGLGLALVKRIVEAHGGAVRVESWEGTGSAFSIVLPQKGGGV